MRMTQAPLDSFPHTCALTGRDDGPVIDTGRELEMHPNLRTHLYLRADALRDLARNHLDMVPLDEVRPLEDKLKELGVRCAELMEQVDTLLAAEAVKTQIIEQEA